MEKELRKLANEHPELRPHLVPILKQAADKTAVDPILKKIEEAIQGKSLMSLRSVLEPMFGKRNVDFSHAGAAHFQIKHKGKKIIIVNKKYVDDAELVVGDLAIGYM